MSEVETALNDAGEECIRVELGTPIKIGQGDAVSVLEFTEPSLGQLKKVDAVSGVGPLSTIELLIAICAGISPVMAGQLKSRDVTRCKDALQYFLPGMVGVEE